ncbi:hypothetical protein E7T06_05835 [Deinococcus sp. Arct2-2]|uniref:hypothetical protein n=1 Tax=Deinococcus sp. Arct2-2 TaxID=2568653 RepID=UPI0010A5090E|nr:hypothetical protein [Deinococcus sp. Arct2-2]THF70863.1 hypothetical protein E7T06_05835 [Deinococcus sp. Arct2-2]
MTWKLRPALLRKCGSFSLKLLLLMLRICLDPLSMRCTIAANLLVINLRFLDQIFLWVYSFWVLQVGVNGLAQIDSPPEFFQSIARELTLSLAKRRISSFIGGSACWRTVSPNHTSVAVDGSFQFGCH